MEFAQKYRVPVFLFFFISGATGLVLEVIWTRILGTVFGNTVFAATTVLTAFMLGLALGSTVLGRLADKCKRVLAVYGALEIGVGAYAFLFPLLSFSLTHFYRWFFRAVEPNFLTLSAVRFCLSLFIILPPTILMGGTLPVLGRFLGVRHAEPGQEVGYLYAVNTIGAVLGCFLAGFVLLEKLGVRGSLFAAGSIALAIGLLAFALGRREALAPATSKKQQIRLAEEFSSEKSSDSGYLFPLILITFGIAGFCSLAYEVLWTRILIFVLTTSVYAFATMLTVFLAGLGLGSFLSARFLVPRTRHPVLSFGIIEVLVGITALGSIPILSRLAAMEFSFLQPYLSPFSLRVIVTLTHFAHAIIVLLIPTLLMGAAFPVVASICIRQKAFVGRRVGQIYAANTIGCVLGSFAAGFIFVPILGVQKSLLAVAAFNFIIGISLIWYAGATSPLARLGTASPLVAILLAFFVLTPADVFLQTIKADRNPSETLFFKEHVTGTVLVDKFPNSERLLTVDGVNVAGLDFMLRSTQKLQGYIPLCLHPNPRSVLQIGFGSGETARVGLEFGVEDYNAVEICPAVFEAAAFFEEINHGSYRDSRARKIIMDGKNYALLSDKKFDIVMNDSTYPGSGGSSALYTYDHFKNCRERLAEDGLFSCWIPLDLRLNEIQMILRSFQEVFPHTTFWIASNCLNKHALILGSIAPLQIDLQRLKNVVSRPAVAEDLRAIEIHNIYDFLDCLVLDENGVSEFVGSAPMNTDNRPLLEISCAVRGYWEENLALVLAQSGLYRAPITPYITRYADEETDRQETMRRFEATGHIFRAHVAQLIRSPKVRRQEYDLALKANPTEVHVASCEAELEREIGDFKTVLQLLPGHPVLLRRLADKYFVALRFPEAAELYKEIIRRRPPPPDSTYVHLAEIHFHFNRTAEAERVLQECLSVWPNSAEAHDRLAGIYLQTGKRDLARRHIEQAVRLAPTVPKYQAHRETILGGA